MSWFIPSKEEKEAKALFKERAILAKLNETRQLLATRKALLLKEKQDLSEEIKAYQQEELENSNEWDRLIEIESNLGYISERLKNVDTLTQQQYTDYKQSQYDYMKEQKKLTEQVLEGSVRYMRHQKLLQQDMQKINRELTDIEMKLIEIQNPN